MVARTVIESEEHGRAPVNTLEDRRIDMHRNLVQELADLRHLLDLHIVDLHTMVLVQPSTVSLHRLVRLWDVVDTARRWSGSCCRR